MLPSMDAALIQTTLAKLLQELNLRQTAINIKKDGDITRVEIDSPDASRIIGWHGETLNAVQHLLKSIVRSALKLDRTPFLLVDVDGYRRMQEDKVKKIAEQKADFVRRTGNRIALAPMSPYFRRIVHLHVAETPTLQDLTTESIGEGDYRQIVLKMKDEKKGAIRGGEELSPIMSTDDGLENLDI
jgi:predicted RNA-binding protein Jag